MDRRSFLKGCSALALSTLLGSASARVTAGGGSLGTTIDDFLEGGSDERRSLLEKLSDDQVLTRHLGNVHSLDSEQSAGERNKVKGTLRKLVIYTHPDAPELYAHEDTYGDSLSLDEALTITSPYLTRFAELSRSTGMDDRFMLAKIARESNGDPLTRYKKALGLTQVEPDTYTDHVNWADLSVISNRAVLPDTLYEAFVSGERPLRDALLFTPEVARSMGLRLDRREIGNEQEYLDRWLPFGIMIEKYHEGTFPSNGNVEETLLSPDSSITSGGLIALSYLLRLNHVTKNAMLPGSSYDPAQVLARSVTPPEALAAAFNAGDGFASGRLRVALLTAEEPTRSAISDAYDVADSVTQDYRSKVLSSTGALQSLTRGTVSLR